jgi:hypothetical protein
MAQDIVDYMLNEIKRVMPEISDQSLIEVEEKARHEFGGDEVYISKKSMTSAQKQKVVTEYLGGRPLREIQKDHGISRATLYRHLKR